MDTSTDSNHQKFDVWLFATDIVNFVFLQSSKLPPEMVVGHFPGFICKDFSNTLKRAVQLIRETVKKDVDEDFVRFQRRNDLNTDAYTKYAKDLRKSRFCQGFEAEAFLHYCVHLALLAQRFYHGGVRRAQVSAVLRVAEDLQDCDLNYGLWEDFNEVAERIVGGIANNKHRPLSRRTATKGTNYFTTPEIDSKDMGITYSVRRRVTDTSKCCSSEGLPKPKHFPGVILSNSCTRVNSRVKNYAAIRQEVMSSLHESLETSLEQLSFGMPSKVVKGEYNPNSTPAESSLSWKPGVLQRITRRNSFEKRIFKLSPINRIKAESINFN